MHVGKPAFYESVYADALSHDVVLVEGVGAPVVRRITRSYRWFVDGSSANLAVQSACKPTLNSRAKIVHADLGREEFEELWRTVPLWLRAAVAVLAPLFGLHQRWFGSLDTLAKALSMDDLPSRSELLNFDPETSVLTEVILHARDTRLLSKLGEELDKPASGVRRLAIVYGASHMRAVLRELRSLGYRTLDSRWMVVFEG